MITLTAAHQAVGSPEGVMTEGRYIYCIIGTSEVRNFDPVGIGDRGDPVPPYSFVNIVVEE